MLMLIERPSAIILNHYKKDSAYTLQKMLGVWDNACHRYTQYLYEFDPEEEGGKEGVLRVPRGMGIERVKQVLNELGLPYNYQNQTESFKRFRDISGRIDIKFPPKDEIQEDSIKFLKDQGHYKHQAFLALNVGRGKTYTTTVHIAQSKKPAMVISYNLAYQWQDKISQYTNLDNGEDGGIVNIVGTQYFEDIMSGKIKPNAVIYITTIGTLHSYQKKFGLNSLQDLADKLGIGIKVFDEAHTRYVLFNSIDMNMQVDETIYLSATPGRSSKNEDRMFSKIYNLVPSFGSFTAKLDDYYIIRYITYDSFSKAEDRIIMKTPRGLSSLKYTRYLFDKYGENILRLMMEYVTPILNENPNGKLLVVTDWIKDIKFIKEWLTKNHPEYSVGTYCQLVTKKTEREKELDKRIIVGTIGSMQNGKDIPNLQIIFPISCFGSSIVTRQLMGRLRPLKDKDVYYFDLADISVPAIMHQRKERNAVLRERSKMTIEEDRVDLDRI